MIEGHCHGIYIEHYICDEVGSLVAPVCNNWLITKLEACNLFKAMLIALALFSDLHDPLQTSFRWHKLEDRVHNQRASELTLECRSFKTRQNFELLSWEINRVLYVKKAGNFTDLFQICLSEGLLDNDVNQVLANWIVRVCEIPIELNNTLCRLVD